MEPIHLGIYEGIKAYVQGDINGEGKLAVFAWDAHMDRFWRSAAIDGLKMPYKREELFDALRDSVKENDFKKNIYIQPRIWPRAGEREEVHVLVPTYSFVTQLPSSNPLFFKQRRFMVSSWRRISSDSLPPQAKTWGNYANSELAIKEARRCGYDAAIFLDSRGFVSEGTAACLMSVRRGKVITPPVTASILESVTRNFFIDHLYPDLGISCEVRDLCRAELYASDEAFLCGTGGEVTPIYSVDDIKIGEKYPGPVTINIANKYTDAVSGMEQEYKNLLYPLN
jgi:branched-chain amino acid aminotransferase